MAATLVYNVRVNDTALDRLIVKTQALGAALYSAQLAAKPLDVQLRAIGRRSTEVGRYLMRNVTTPLLLAGAAAGKMGYDFDTSLAKTRALTDTSKKSMDEFTKSVLDLGRAGLGSPKELADALYFIRSSGVPASKTVDVLTNSAKAATAGLGDLASVADTVTSAMNTYSDANKKAAYFTDTLLATVRVGKAEPDALGKAIGRVLPLAHQMGVTFDEAGGMIAALTQQGLSADSSVTGLRATLQTFVKQLKPTKDGLAGLGFRFTDVQKAIGEQGLFPVLLRLRKEVDKFGKTGGALDARLVKAAKLGGLDKAVEALHKELGDTSSTLVGKLFPNVRALTSFLILTSHGGKQAAAAIDQVHKSAGETGRDLDKALGSPAKQLQRTWRQLKTEVTEIGRSLYPLLTKVLRVMKGVFSAFNSLPGPIKEFIALNVALLALVGPLFYAFGQFARLQSIRAIRRIAEEHQYQAELARTAAAQKAVAVAAGQAGAAQVAAARTATAAQAKLTMAQVRTVPNAISPGGLGIVNKQTGRFVSPKNVETPPVLAFRGMGREGTDLRKATTGLRTSFRLARVEGASAFAAVRTEIAAARVAMVGFMAAIWPLLAFEGVLLLITNWKTVSRVIGDATNKLLIFLHLQKHMPDPAAETLASAKALTGTTKRLADEMTRLHKTGLKWSAAMKQATTNVLGGDFHSDAKDFGLTIARALEVATGRIPLVAKKTGKQLAAEITKGAADELASDTKIASAFKKNLAGVQDVFKSSWSSFVDKLMQAFDAHTEEMVKNIVATVRVNVGSLQEVFKIRQGGLTPAERELKALDAIQTKRRDAEAIADARQRVREARGKRLVETQVGNRIFGFQVGADPKALKEAQRGLRDAQEQQTRDHLEAVATIERTAADKALAEEEKQLRARRELRKQSFKDELSALYDQIRKNKLTVQQAHAEIMGLMKKYGVDYHQAGLDLGGAFATGLHKSMQGLMRQITRVKRAFDQVVAIQKQIKDSQSAAAKARQAVLTKRPAQTAAPKLQYGPPLPSTFQRGEPLPDRRNAGRGPAQPNTTTQNNTFNVTSPALAEATANKVYRKMVRR